MNPRLFAAVLALPLLVLGGPVVSPLQAQAAMSTTPETDWLNNPLAQRDHTLRWDHADAFNAGTFDDTKLDDAGRLVLDTDEKEYPRRGSWTSPELDADFPITELLPSFNLDAPDHTGARMLFRLRDAKTGRWSPWLDLDGYGETRMTGRGSVIDYDRGTVEIDYVRLNQPADAVQARLELVAFNTDADVTPAVRKLVAVYSGPLAEAPVLERGAGTMVDAEPKIDLRVPFLRQLHNGPAMAPRTCSPTSTTMVLRYHGVSADPVETSDAIYDRRYGLFGNWSRAVSHASTLGLDAELQRFRTWDDLRDVLASGTPVIASIRFKAGEFPSNQMNQTAGHLIVVRGLDANGDAIVNDPAYDTDNEGDGVIYKAEELARAWLAKGGVGYVIRKAE